ncbi:family 16 glycosylhydrolase [Catenovulum sediminis]|uniref:Family 16 glycosylhydrolase n=1 Tax=Catenovulum sediminis TaxID=1740262 RepID=A0ABV1RDL0_9ALTE
MKTKILRSALLFGACLTQVNAQISRPVGAIEGQLHWQILENRSDDFNANLLDSSKWVSAPKDLVIGAWTFDKNNSYIENGKLKIKATQETHTRWFNDSCWDGKAGGPAKRVERTLYYKSGAVKSLTDGVYGYYEAKIKGVEVFPGLSPAFWLYSDGHPYDDRNVPGSVDYSEIDIVELQQADWHGPGPDDADPINVTDHNLHARLVNENGQTFWRRPKPYPDAQLLQYHAPFDPSADYHTYAVENRKDRIFWYVDGKLIGSKKNLYWHRPMHLIFSMGLRRQLIKYNGNCQRADPNPNTVTSVGFPEKATMSIDYVKSWKVLPSIWLENLADIANNTLKKDTPLTVKVHYHGGSDHYVSTEKYGGIRLNLVEKNHSGIVKIVASASNTSAANHDKKYGGVVEITLDLTNVTATTHLPDGHYYTLAPVFRSSNGEDVYLTEPVNPLTIE